MTGVANESLVNETFNMHNVSRWMLSNRVEAYVVPVIFAIIFLIGLVGNGSLIWIVIRNSKLHNTPNIMIVSLAIGDLLLIAFCVPFISTVYTYMAWPYGVAICKMREFLRTMSMGVSIFTLTALSGERYVAIVYPMSLHKGSHMKRTLLIATLIWIVSILLAAVDAIAATVQNNAEHHSYLVYCTAIPREWGPRYEKFYPMFQFIVFFAIPVITIGIFYVLMARMLWMSGNMVPGMQSTANSGPAAKQLEARKKVAKLVLSFVIIFAVCWLPRHIFHLWFHYDPGEYNMFWHVFKILSFCLHFINSCVNPIALYLLSNQFRKLFNQYLFGCCMTRQHEPAEYSYASKTYNFQTRNHSAVTEKSMV